MTQLRPLGARCIAVVILSTLGCGGATVKEPRFASDVIEAQPDTTLGPGDVFDVRVFGEEDLSSTFRVASDGGIDFPLLGVVNVEGRTPTEVSKLVEKGLREGDFLKNPQVSIFVKEYNSKKISVFGQVKQPGNFPYRDGMSVVEAISQAGGFTSMARKNDTTVIRVVEGKKERFQVQVEAIGQGRVPNFFLRTGDIVFVPERIF
jgi:polysaccharide export outer membrane protein